MHEQIFRLIGASVALEQSCRLLQPCSVYRCFVNIFGVLFLVGGDATVMIVSHRSWRAIALSPGLILV
jgi:hypothetical protein